MVVKKLITIGLIIILQQSLYSFTGYNYLYSATPKVHWHGDSKYIDAYNYNEMVKNYNDCRSVLTLCVKDLNQQSQFLEDLKKQEHKFPWKPVLITGGVCLGFGFFLGFFVGFYR